MSSIIKYSDLTDIIEHDQSAKLDEHIIQPIMKVKWEGQDCFFKGMPNLYDPKAQKIRVINEAIYGKIAEVISMRFNNKFLTPRYQLVVDNNNELMGLLTVAIPYDFAGDYGTSKKDLMKFMQCKAFPIISALRYIFSDPDAANNIGYAKESKDSVPELSSIDYGLAGIDTLLKLNALLPEEKEKFGPSIQSFEITLANLLAGPVQNMDDVEFLAIHLFGFSASEYLEKIGKENKDSLNTFIRAIESASRKVGNIISEPKFKESIRLGLDYENLSAADKEIFDTLFSSIELKSRLFKEAENKLRHCTVDDLAELQEAVQTKNNYIANSILESPRLFSVKNVNIRAQSFVSEESKKLTVGGRISPANGGDHYKEILTPIPLFAIKRTTSAPASNQRSSDSKSENQSTFSRSMSPFTLS